MLIHSTPSAKPVLSANFRLLTLSLLRLFKACPYQFRVDIRMILPSKFVNIIRQEDFAGLVYAHSVFDQCEGVQIYRACVFINDN